MGLASRSSRNPTGFVRKHAAAAAQSAREASITQKPGLR